MVGWIRGERVEQHLDTLAAVASRFEKVASTQALFQLNGQLSGDGGGSSTALTQTLGSAALATNNPARVQFVENAWNVYQQTGLYRYYQQCVYLLGLLATSGWYGYEWAPPAQ